jgi:protoporphyrinogen oxidase
MRGSLDTPQAGWDSCAVPSTREQVVIIGAGLAGLAAAIRLRRGFRLLERRAVPGGLADTVEDRGFRFDRTGHLLHLSDQSVRRLVRDLLGDRLLEIRRNSRIFSHGVYSHYPFQANTYGLPREVVAECLIGFVEAFAARRGERARARSFEEFILTNFGRGIAKHFMLPYNRKLWGLHPREITDEWCDRFVPTPALEEVVAGAVGQPQDRLGYNATFYYPKLGIGELTRAMAGRVADIEYDCAPSAIDFRKRRLRVRGAWIPYRALITSVPLDRLAHLLVEPPERVSRAASQLRCASLRYLDVALDRRPGTPYHWSYVPERKYPFYRVGSYSSFSRAMAPTGNGSLYVELASRRPVDLGRLMPKVVEGLTEMGIIERAADIAFVRPKRIRQAYVVYDASWSQARSKLLGWLAERHIFCVGRYGRWEYAAMEDAIAQGFDAADTVKKL